jgi:hypothetical protein
LNDYLNKYPNDLIAKALDTKIKANNIAAPQEWKGVFKMDSK